MPSAPLYYQPLVQARVLATPIGDTTVYDAQQLQKERTQKAYEQYAPAMDGILRGFEGMQGSMPGSKSLDLIQFAYDDTGYIANRVATAMRLHPNLFDTASPDQAAEIGANLVQQAAKELSEDPGMKAVGDTLEITPKATALFEKHWIGANPLAPEEIAYLGVVTGRELQHAVTPTEPDSEHKLQWIEDAGAEILALWPGAAARTAAALGVKLDEAGAAAVGTVVDGWRQDKTASDEHLRSTIALLGAAGIAGTDDVAANATFAVLQSTPLEGVPMGIAQAIVGQGKLPDEAVPYVAGRIVETGGSEGNVKGLLAELEQLQQPAPGVPPPIEPPPAEPPPGVPPPVEPPPAEPPPVEPPPVDEPASVTS